MPSIAACRAILEKSEEKFVRHKSDKKVLDEIDLKQIIEMPFTTKKTVEFEPKFDVDMIKLEPKSVPKVSRAERRKR